MNNKGFTLVELLAVIVLLSIILGIGIISGSNIFGKASLKSEDVFVENLKNMIDIYVTKNGYTLFKNSNVCNNPLEKNQIGSNNKRDVTVVYTSVSFGNIINNSNGAFELKDFKNSSNPDSNKKNCNVNAMVSLYRDSDYVYYYSFDKNSLDCLMQDGIVSTLPSGYGC